MHDRPGPARLHEERRRDPGGRDGSGGGHSSPRMKASTFSRARESSYCSGGDFMK